MFLNNFAPKKSELSTSFLRHILKIAKIFVTSVCLSVCLSVRMDLLGPHWTDFRGIWYLCIFRKSVRKLEVAFLLEGYKGYFTWTNVHFLSYSAEFFSDWEMFRQKLWRKSNTHFTLFFIGKRSVMRKNAHPDRPQMTIWRMCIACWITKATNTHWKFLILTALLLRQWLHERASLLYVRCLSFLY